MVFKEKVLLFTLISIFLIFGTWKILNPTFWYSYSPIYNKYFIMFLGVFEIIFSILLLTKFRKIAAIIISLHMISIIIYLTVKFGFNEIVVRDLAILAIAIYFLF